MSCLPLPIAQLYRFQWGLDRMDIGKAQADFNRAYGSGVIGLVATAALFMQWRRNQDRA